MLSVYDNSIKKLKHVFRNVSITQIIGPTCRANYTINIPAVQNHEVLYTTQLIKVVYEDDTNGRHGRHVAILGEMDKLGLISKSRIDRIETFPSITGSDMIIEMNGESIFEIRLHLLGQKDEHVSFSWTDNNLSTFAEKFDHIILKHTCVIGENNSVVFTIKFPHNESSFAECS